MRLPDAELARRVRERNMRANQARRERLTHEGRVQLGGLWIPKATRERLDTYAGWKAMQLSDVVTLALDKLIIPELPHFDPTHAFPTPHDELQALAKKLTATPPLPPMEEWKPEASDPPLSVDTAADLDCFSADPNSEVNGGAVRHDQRSRPATIRDQNTLTTQDSAHDRRRTRQRNY
jgi:hypothetical protein